jgi:hypothetical protein
MRTSRILSLAVALFLLVPLGAAAAGEVDGDLKTGLYSDDYDTAPDLNATGAAAGQKVTFGGTFHDVAENQSAATAGFSRTRSLRGTGTETVMTLLVCTGPLRDACT